MKRFFLFLFLSVAVFRGFSDVSELELFARAENSFTGKNYETALERYDVFLKAFPASELAADAQFRRAVSLYQLGRYTESVELFRRVEMRYRSTRYLSRIPFWRGMLYYRLGEYEGAVREFSLMILEEQDPETTEYSLLYSSLSRNALRRYAEAAASFRSLIERSGSSRRGEYALVMLSSLSEESAEAGYLDLWNLSASELKKNRGSLDADSADLAMLLLGEYEFRNGRHDEASAYLEPLAGKGPSTPHFARASYFYAFSLLRTGKTAEALAAVEKVMAARAAGDLNPGFLRLLADILIRRDSRSMALEVLTEYLEAVPGDQDARMEVVRLLAALKNYSGLKEAAAGMLKDIPDLDSRNPVRYHHLVYLQGMAELNLGNYAASAALLRGLDGASSSLPEDAVLSALFYAGFSHYKLAAYTEALETFRRTLGRMPREHELYLRAVYYAAWCAYSLGRFEEGSALLSDRPGTTDRVFQAKTRFLAGQTFFAMGRYREAAEEYRRIFTVYTESEIAADAHFEYAGVFEKTGDTVRALEEYRKIAGLYPASPLAESALFRRGEILSAAGRWADARDAFYEYRAAFPNGRYFDQALYWGGRAALGAGERHGALLLWENLADRYRDSSFRPGALRETAEIYARLGEYSRAAARYAELIEGYPREAETYEARKRLDEIRLIQSGAGEHEAALLVRIRGAGGAASPEGREAMLELARFYIREGGTGTDRAAPLIADIRRRRIEDPGRAAEAGYLLAEIERRRQRYPEAATLYLAAASEQGADGDLVARSLLRAAEMMRLSGRADENRRLLEMLVRNFPGTEWAAEGRKLLGGTR